MTYLIEAVWPYTKAVFVYFWVLIPGLLTLLEVYNWHSHERWHLKLPRWARLGIAITALMLAQFLAYRDSISNLSTVIREKRELSIGSDALMRRNHELEGNLAAAKQALHDATLMAGLRPPIVIRQSDNRAENQRAEQARRAKIRRALGVLLSQGVAIQQSIIRDQDASYAQLVSMANDWDKRTEVEIRSNLGEDYVARYGSPAGLLPLSPGAPIPGPEAKEKANLWSGMNNRLTRLTQFLEELKP